MRCFLISIIFFITTTQYAFSKNWEVVDGLSYVYLTWSQEDTSRHITINYHSQQEFDTAQVFYSLQPRQGRVSEYEGHSYGGSRKIGHLHRAIHNVTLNELKANTTYYFIVGDFKTGFSKEYKFKTLPADNSPIKFITGGDMGARVKVEDMLILAAQRNPDFVAIGGDIAYADGLVSNYKKWDEWLSMYTDTMVTADGHLIPMTLALGNHEVNLGASYQPETKAPFFFGLFNQGLNNKAYFKRTFGSHTIMYYLDSGFLTYFGGEQKKWMSRSMSQSQNILNQLAIYHIPLYPSHRSYNGIQNRWARSTWLEVFDKYNLDLAFENHDHTFKVTHPLKNGQIDPTGTIYLGDGCWGRSPRSAHPDRWYLKEASSTVHIWEVTVSGQGARYEAIADGGSLIYSSINTMRSSTK